VARRRPEVSLPMLSSNAQRFVRRCKTCNKCRDRGARSNVWNGRVKTGQINGRGYEG
jgi:hypothetical protein